MGPWIADHGPQGGESKNRDVVAVVDFCDRIDAGHQPGGPHDGERREYRRSTRPTRPIADSSRLTGTCLKRSVVLVNGMNQRRDPIIGKAGTTLIPLRTS